MELWLDMGRELEGCRVLVVDDEPLIAMDLAEELEAAGAVVVGPTNSIKGASALLDCQTVNLAVLDIRLDGQLVYPLAETLAAQAIPFVFSSGLDADGIPEKFADVPICNKPFAAEAIVRTLCAKWPRRALPPNSGPVAQSPTKLHDI